MTDREFIHKLSEVYTERRSDISDICKHYLKTGELKESLAENRWIQAKIPGTDIEVEYDTLTTEVSYHKPLEQWKACILHNYSND